MGQLHADEYDIRPNQPIYGNNDNNHIKWVPAESLTDKKIKDSQMNIIQQNVRFIISTAICYHSQKKTNTVPSTMYMNIPPINNYLQF